MNAAAPAKRDRAATVHKWVTRVLRTIMILAAAGALYERQWLNSQPNVRLRMAPGFVALFAFTFAVAVGTIWEIFEFTMDTFLGTNMQKPMLGDPSGLTDTMIDLILDAMGALVVSLIGYAYMKQDTHSFIERWIEKFVETNPRLFTKERRRGGDDDLSS